MCNVLIAFRMATMSQRGRSHSPLQAGAALPFRSIGFFAFLSLSLKELVTRFVTIYLWIDPVPLR